MHSRIENAIVSGGLISGHAMVGGIAGNVTGTLSGSLLNDTASVAASLERAGGIAGLVQGRIDAGGNTVLENRASILGNGSHKGGIFGDYQGSGAVIFTGVANPGAGRVQIKNSGAVGVATSGDCIGGVIGFLGVAPAADTVISNFTNTVEVKGSQLIGGIVGQLNSGTLAGELVNTNAVVCNGMFAGGIAGLMSMNARINTNGVTVLENRAPITGEGGTKGGLFGFYMSNGAVTFTGLANAGAGHVQIKNSGAVGNGIVRSGIVSATMGTSGVVFAHADSMVPNAEGNLQSFCHAVPDKWCVFGCMLSAGGSLQWLRDTLWADQVAALRKAKKDPGSLYPSLIKEAEKAAAGSESLLFLPYLTGERCPYPDPTARGAWVGLTVRHRRAHLIRSVVEGITFGMRDQIEIMRSRGVPITEVRASGGGSASAFWRQMQADMYNAKVVTINTREGGALGVALLAAVGTGLYDTVPQACAAAIRATETLKPEKATAAVYNKLHATYRSLYQSLRADFGALN